ncbi:hypothetical protein GCM10008014_49700 [Paenibacillus silvae]|uniref:Tyr recombinase domain-containing protein n=1 Tax=Paenibacillus silvae TaxID=1325358 RepID=A0ABQ1ZLA0_9BACL|nr:hypothetical protein GCM10008014_49700 [Paenibacillus silvae]
MKAAGIKGVSSRPNNIQHTFAELYIIHEGDTYNLQDILAYVSQDMVKKYVNLW